MTMATMEPAASFAASPSDPHARSRHHPHPHPHPHPRSYSALPASPTLTNPDMILPEYDRAPSPVALGHPAHSMSLFSFPQSAEQPRHYDAYTTANANPSITTPIIYGNGTMLSDIGEVTEAESTPARPSPPRNRYAYATTATAPPNPFAIPAPRPKVEDSEGDAAMRSSPTIGKPGAPGGVKKRAKAAHRERRSSSDSTSTITDHDQVHQIPVFADFDDTISVGDSVFQGDDEESIASSYVDDAALAGAPALLPGLHSRDSGQKYSTAQLSKRAEQILANAKKRLTHMEDNLTRARSSLLVATNCTGSTTPSPSPPIARASTALMMSSTGQMSPGPDGHHRSGSDNSLRIGIPVKVYPQRSSSVLGISTGPRHPGLTISRSADQLNGQFNRQRASYMVTRDLEPLGEDDVPQPQRRSAVGNPNRNSSLTSPTVGASAERGLSRSASTSHMRDIRDQVNDLKGKISSLREQARADSLKRSSLQNLRTPSPFTHAKTDQWYTKTADDSDPSPRVQSLGIQARSIDGLQGVDSGPERDERLSGVSPKDGTVEPTVAETANMDRLEQLSPDPFEYGIGMATTGDNEDLLTENGDAEDDGVVVEEAEYDYKEATEDSDDAVSEGGDSIYHESMQHHLSHEDREDAFDYEHFFLHSAMGTISQKLAHRASISSFTSEDSVETTRAPVAETQGTDPENPPRLIRRGSDASISTMESFATAEERLYSRQGSLDLSRQEEAEANDEMDMSCNVAAEAFPVLQSCVDVVDRPQTPLTARRATCTGAASPFHNSSSRIGPAGTRVDGLTSAVRRPMSSMAFTRPHAPSVSSFESTGTTRSFPLVKRPASKSSGSSGVLTPEGRASESDARATSGILGGDRVTRSGNAVNEAHKHSISMHSTSSTTSLIEENGTTAVMETLPRDDQFLVERLVASLGRCVLGLTENSRASTEARMYRRRIDAARRILEGFDKV